MLLKSVSMKFACCISIVLVLTVVSCTPKNYRDDIPNPKPNVLTIIIDDAGYKDIGYHGGNIATPIIDQLASQAMRLRQFYTYSTCTPTRVALLTGRAPSRSGIVWPIRSDDNHGIPADVETLPEAFKNNGYKTAIIGKWHLGEQPDYQPLKHGFDYQYGLNGGWFDQFTRENPESGYDWVRNGETLPREEGSTTDLLTDDAIRYIENDGGQEPFFMYLSYTAPHVPIQVEEKWAAPYEDRFDTRTRVGYAGMMSHLDYSIGRVVEALKKKGVLKNTIIVFLSDNGPSSPGKKWYIPEEKFTTNFYGNDGEYGAVGDLRGWKASPYEGGIKVPGFIYWPGKVEAQDWVKPVIVQDLYPTLLGLAGARLSEGYKLEARDILNTDEPVKFYWRTFKDLALRSGDWKLILQNKTPFEDDLQVELFDLKVDPTESNNQIEINNQKYQELLEMLKEEFNKDPEDVYVRDDYR